MNQFFSIIELIGNQAAAQLAGPWAFLARIVLKVAVKILDYYKIKHELKKQFDEKLKSYEAAQGAELTKEKKDEALDNFLK